jgi:hypothetical protein
MMGGRQLDRMRDKACASNQFGFKIAEGAETGSRRSHRLATVEIEQSSRARQISVVERFFKAHDPRDSA